MKLDAFLEIEQKYRLIQDTVGGFAYWTYFRCDLKWELEQLASSCNEIYIAPKRSFWQKTKTRMQSVRCALFFGRLPKKRCDLLIFNHERRVWIKDHYECIYTDQIAARYPNSIVLERPYFQQHYRPVKTRSLVYTDSAEIRAMLFIYWQKLMGKKKMLRLKNVLRKKMSRPLAEICKAYQITYDMDSILDKMVCGYFEYQIKKDYFGKILDKVKPKAILEVVGYDLDCMVINELACKRGIPTIELQHGTTGPEHIPYNYYPGTKVVQAPQYFFAFSRFWIEAAKHPMPVENMKETGFPFLDKRGKEIKRKVSKKAPRQIIFISQYPVGEMLSGIAVELNRMIDPEQYQIIYKLHPDEYEGWRGYYPKLAASGIKVYDDNHADLYRLLAESTYQVGGYSSTATFEGLAFDLKTFVLRQDALADLQLLCEKKMARYIDNAQDLYRLLMEDAAEPEQQIRFWKDNALKNMKREIDVIIKPNQ